MADPTLYELRCPTCRSMFDLEIRRDPAPIEPTDLGDVILPSPPAYIRCQRGHKWSLKTVTRAVNRPDRVLLGEYLGDG